MEHIIKALDKSATAEAPKIERFKRILLGVALIALGVLLMGAFFWSMWNRALWYSGVSKLIGIAGMVPLLLGLDRLSPGLSRRLLGTSGKRKKHQ